MKKWLVIVLVCVAAVAWAQEDEEGGTIKVTGEVKSGINFTKVGENDFGVRPYSDDADKNFHTQVQVDYTRGSSGASVRLVADELSTLGSTTVSYFSPLSHAYGWIGLFDDKFEFSGGILDNNKWGTLTSFNLDTSMDNANGLKLEFKLIEGLSFGVNVLNAQPGTSLTVKESFKPIVFGGKYTTEQFGIAAEFVTASMGYTFWGNKWDKGPNQVSTGSGTPSLFKIENNLTQTTFGALFSGFYYGVENLTLEMDGSFAMWSEGDVVLPGTGGIQTVDQPEASIFGLSAQGLYTINDLVTAGLKIDFSRFGTKYQDDDTSAMSVVFIPKAAFTLNPTVGLGLEATVGLIDMLSMEGFDDWNSGLEIAVKPSATFTFSKGFKAVLFYKLDNVTHGYTDSEAASNPKLKDSLTTHTIQLDMIWAF
ncbi:MAG: hypothetical protein LBD22_02735 [Spirochaetaceae bacterium]|jgi:hypothetical protein|nr:hypothetical protein [Spirochaetaceae bacterium]